MSGASWRELVLALAALTVIPGGASGEPESDEEPRAVQRHVMLGRCELSVDPASDTGRSGPRLFGCLKAALGAEMTFVSGTPEENAWLKYGNVYGGLFLTRWLSVQARGHVREIVPLGDLATAHEEAVADYSVVQIGNPALHSARLTAGKMRLPFGIDRTSVTEHYRSFEDRRFWDSPDHGAYLTIDNRHTTQTELGFATNAFADRKRHPDDEGVAAPTPGAESEKEATVQAMSLRFMTDFAALDGSRLVLSGYGEDGGVRRMGAGFLAVSRRDDLTLFEFARRLSTPSGNEAFSQLLRVGYVGAWRGNARWVVQFDDERFRFRRGIVGHDIDLYKHAMLRFGVSYHKSETGDGLRRWYVTSGLEARL